MKIWQKQILAGAVYLSLTVGGGYLSLTEQQNLSAIGKAELKRVSDIGVGIYDTTFQGMHHIQTMQTDFIRFAARRANASGYDEKSRADLSQMLANLDLAAQKASQEKTRARTLALRTEIADLQANMDKITPAGLDAIDKELSALVENYASDAYDYRAHIDEVVQNANAELTAILDNNKKMFTEVVVGSTILAVIVATLIIQSTVPPVIRALEISTSIANGKLDNHIVAKGKSETDMLMKALAAMQSSIAENIRKVEEHSKEAKEKAEMESRRKSQIEAIIRDFENVTVSLLESVSHSASEMKQSAQLMANNITKTDSNLQKTVVRTNEAYTNISAVAAASEELTASINEISQQVTRSASITQKAVTKAQEADGTIKRLTQAAQKINEIVEMISNITGQINLLALNATIEAARAGDAGKGFAVVASEVKNLATQTSNATDAISEQISGIQTAVEAVVETLNNIRGTINEMGGISSNIASAMEEQGAATQEIARNIQVTSLNVQEVSSNIDEVGHMSKETNQASTHVLGSVNTFSGQAEDLSNEIKKFLKKIS